MQRHLHRLADSGQFDSGEVSVAEIGAGVGRAAYWAHRFGVKAYTIFDLPHINVLQGFYLSKSLPDVNVRLYAEPHLDDGRASIAVLPEFARASDPIGRFDLVLNQDSFPEINDRIVRDYLRWIRTSSRTFLSINHESRPRSVGDARQNSVPDLIREVGGFRRISRQLYWLRKGYVAECYAVV